MTPISDRVLLNNVTTGETRTLDVQVGKPNRVLFADQVLGDFASWTWYTVATKASTVFRYQISTSTTVKIPTPTGKQHSASSVGPNGEVF